MLAAKEQQKLLLDALRRIPLDYQIALELHYWEGFTAAQTAEVVGLPLGTVKTRLRRGRQLVEAVLEELVQAPELRHSTVSDLDRWAAGLRAQLQGGA